MDPATGTFTTMDTYGGSLSDPMSLHKYLFANSNPVMYSDPSGHMSVQHEGTVISIITVLANALVSTVSSILSFLESNALCVHVFVVTSIIALAVIVFIMGYSTSTNDVGNLVLKKSLPQSVLDAINERIAKAIPLSEALPRKYKSDKELHHIVAKRSLRFNFAHLSRIILSKSGYRNITKLDQAEVDDPDNLMLIKTSMHKRLHTSEYHAYVYATLNSVYKETESVENNHIAVKSALITIKAQLRTWEISFPG